MYLFMFQEKIINPCSRNVISRGCILEAKLALLRLVSDKGQFPASVMTECLKHSLETLGKLCVCVYVFLFFFLTITPR